MNIRIIKEDHKRRGSVVIDVFVDECSPSIDRLDDSRTLLETLNKIGIVDTIANNGIDTKPSCKIPPTFDVTAKLILYLFSLGL